MDCPGSKVGFVIGRKGTAIAAINERSGCRISIDTNQLQDPRKIYLQGLPDQVTTAMQLISRVLSEGPSAILPEQSSAAGSSSDHDPHQTGTAASGDGSSASGEASSATTVFTETFPNIVCPPDKVRLIKILKRFFNFIFIPKEKYLFYDNIHTFFIRRFLY